MSFQEDLSESLKKDLEDPNGYWNTIKKKKILKEKRFNKFKKLIEENKINISELLDRIFNEHNEEYKDKCYKNGYEPYPNNKLSFLFSYIEHVLDPIKNPEFIDDYFSTVVYYYKGFYIAKTNGQGSFIHIYDNSKERIFTI